MTNNKPEKKNPTSEFESAEKQLREYSATPSPIIENWGPQETVAGKGFNVQADGTSTLWFLVRRYNNDVVATINGEELANGAYDLKTSTYSASVPSKFYSAPGVYEVVLVDKTTGKKSNQEHFLVRPR